MRVRRRIRSTIAIGAVLAVVASSAAIADELVNDGDVLSSGVQPTLAFGTVCANETATRSVDHWLTKQTAGGQSTRAADGSTVTVSAAATPARLSVASPAATIQIPSNWNSLQNGTASDTVTSTVTFTAGAVTGAFSESIPFTATGTAANGTAMTLSRSLAVTANVVNCTSATTTSAADATATFGDASATLSATVSPSNANVGTLTFTIKDGATTVGTVTSGTVSSGSATASFPLAGVNAGTYTVDAAYSGGPGFAASDNAAQTPKPMLTVDKAATTTSVTCTAGPFTFTGDPFTPCSATVTGHGLDADVPVTYTDNVDAGTATANASYPGGTNHAASSGEATFAIGKAASRTVVTCPDGPFPYTGSAQTPCSATVSGPGGLSGSVPMVHMDNTDAGTATATAIYAESDNHQGSTGSTTFVIGEADTTTTITCAAGPFTYDGDAQTPCSARVTGPGLDSSVPVEYSGNVDAGTATATATYAGTSNLAGSRATTTFTIGQTTSTTTVTCPDTATYDGDLQTPCTATVTGAGDLDETADVVYEDNRNAGTATASASFAETTNHLGSTGSATFTIEKAETTTTVTCAAGPFTFTGSAQTPCSATTTGAGGLSTSTPVVYGNNTDAGTATANATYAGGANHLVSVADEVTFTIDKAPTETTVDCPESVTYDGQPQEPCTATVSGADLDDDLEVRYQNNTDAGTATASADYAESDNHLASSDTEHFTIDKASTTTTVTCDAGPFTYTGSAQTPCSAEVTGPGGLALSLVVTYTGNVAAGTATAAASYAEDDNYEASANSTEFSIGKAKTTTTVTCDAGPFTYTGSAQTPCTATVTGAGDLDESATVVYVANTDAGTATASASYEESDNHLASDDSTTFAIGRAASTTTVDCPATQTFTGEDIEPCTAEVTGVGGLEETLEVEYENNRSVGTATASATYPGGDNHDGSSDSEGFEIERAATITTVTCDEGPFVYDTEAHEPCTAWVTGPGGLDEPVTVVYVDNVNAGTASASATFAGDDDRESSTNTETFAIAKAASTVSVTCTDGPFTYDGEEHKPCSARATGPGLNEALTVTYTDNVDAGTATASAAFGGGPNHEGDEGSTTFEIEQAASTVTVTCTGAPFTYTGSPQEPCTAEVTGAGGLAQSATVAYEDNTGAGTAKASASYEESDNHLASSASTTFEIEQAASTVTITCTGAPFTYTGSAQTPCTAKATGAGGLDTTLDVAYQGNTNAGPATVNASFAGGPNHLGSTGSTTFTIAKAASVVSITCTGGPFTETGSAIEPCSARATGPGGLNEVLTVTYTDNVEVGLATATASYGGGINHLASEDEVTFNIGYSSTGILQPINSNGSSVFKINSTIPVKLKLTGASAGFGGGNFTVALTRLGATVEGDQIETVTSTSAHSGNTMRYDAKDDQYIFNLGTKGLKVGTYRLTVTLDDGTTRIATFGLR